MLDVVNLSKTIEKKTILTDLSFQVNAGEMLILLGRNGSGKSLLLSILATLVKPTSGRASISGIDLFTNLNQVRPHIGYLPETSDIYSELSIFDYLNFFASAYRLERKDRIATIESVMELMDIQHHSDSKVDILSTGERQRLLFAKTFLHEPQLWLIDGPLTLLDPHGQVEMVELLNELKVMGRTIIIATNRLDDVLKLGNIDIENESNTDKLGILSNAKFAVFNTINQLQHESKDRDNTEELKPSWLAKLYMEVTQS